MFETFVITLDRRPKRWDRFKAAIPAGWPGSPPLRWPAVDGIECDRPLWFKASPGAWGCLQSHLSLWRWQVKFGYNAIMVLEDDAVFCRGVIQRLEDVFACIPDDWDQIYFGGQHLNTNDLPPETVIQDRLIRCRYVNRTHAYMIRLPFAEAALEAIDRPFDTTDPRLHHVDYQLGEMHASGKYNIYAPWRFFIGQASGESDVRSNRRGKPQHVREHWWNHFPIVEPAGVA